MELQSVTEPHKKLLHSGQFTRDLSAGGSVIPEGSERVKRVATIPGPRGFAQPMEEQVRRFERNGDISFASLSTGSGAATIASSALAVIDHSRLRRECLKLALGHHNPQWRVSEFSAADEMLRAVAAGETIDLVLIGAATSEHIDLVQLEGVREALPIVPVVVVAENGNPHRARQILNAGARGFLPASLSLKVLMGALDLVLAGGVYVPSSLLESAPQRHGAWDGEDRPIEPWSELTRRQRDVLALISQGKSNKLIADALTMSESTVKAHVKQIIKRLHVSNRTQAALLATGHGPFTPPPTLNGGLDVQSIAAK
jgi:DNA-binding NarL/FixJ family response regulator